MKTTKTTKTTKKYLRTIPTSLNKEVFFFSSFSGFHIEHFFRIGSPKNRVAIAYETSKAHTRTIAHYGLLWF